MKELLEYMDYRSYLQDYYAANKKSNKYFSYRYFSRKAGIKSPNFLKAVMEGERNLTRVTMEGFSHALGLDAEAKKYFIALVRYNQARSSVDKQERYASLQELLKKIQPKNIPRNMYDYFEHWYNPVIRELVCMLDFRDDYKLLASAVYPTIRPLQAKKAVKLLEEINMVKKLKNGRYTRADPILTTGKELKSMAVRGFNDAMLENARESLVKLPPEKRHVSGITLSVSRNGYELIGQAINQFKDTVLQIVHDDKIPDEVYQMNVQMFPLSQLEKKKNV